MIGMIIEPDFELGEMVYLKTDPEHYARLVTSYKVCVEGTLTYGLSCGMSDSCHFGAEITREKVLEGVAP